MHIHTHHRTHTLPAQYLTHYSHTYLTHYSHTYHSSILYQSPSFTHVYAQFSYVETPMKICMPFWYALRPHLHMCWPLLHLCRPHFHICRSRGHMRRPHLHMCRPLWHTSALNLAAYRYTSHGILIYVGLFCTCVGLFGISVC